MSSLILSLHRFIYLGDSGTALVNPTACGGGSNDSATSAAGQACNTGLPTVAANSGTFETILQFAFGIIGGVALIIVIISAMRFVISGGEPNDVKQARETLIYALVGVAVCLSAEILVTFVLNNV